MCTVGEDVVQVKAQSSKEDREKRGWTQLGVDGFVYPGLVSVYTSAQDMVGAMDIGPRCTRTLGRGIRIHPHQAGSILFSSYLPLMTVP